MTGGPGTVVTRTTKGRKRRETAVLTDIPIKNQLEAEKKKSNANKSKVKRKMNFCKNPKPNKKQKIQDSSDEDEAQYCIVCLESYSRSKEIWLQCCSCKAWAYGLHRWKCLLHVPQL